MQAKSENPITDADITRWCETALDLYRNAFTSPQRMEIAINARQGIKPDIEPGDVQAVLAALDAKYYIKKESETQVQITIN